MLVRSLLAAACSSLALLPAVHAQDQTPLPEITAGPAATGCGGCYVVADVLDYVFGTETFTLTNTVSVGVMTGRNGTKSTTTQIAFGQPQEFTFGTAGLFTATNAGGSFVGGNSVVTLSGGIVLTSPTQYQIFTAYSLTTSVVSDGNCVAVLGTVSSLTSPYVVTITADDPGNLVNAENSFISFVGRPSCSAAGVNVQPTTQTPIVTASATVTNTGPLQVTPQPIVTPSTSTAPSTTSASPSSSAAASTTTISATATIVIITPNTTTPFFSSGGFPTMSMVPFPGAAALMSAPPEWLLWSVGALALLIPTLLV